jgi:glyoxylase-like metal-dependent hydrolase (beta-lactamase superfamily II)
MSDNAKSSNNTKLDPAKPDMQAADVQVEDVQVEDVQAVDSPSLVYDLGGVYLLDTCHQGRVGIIGSYLVPHADDPDQFMLIECGPGSALDMLEQAVKQAGFNMEHLSSVLVTHIHLDHAGAAGALAQKYGAHVYVHEGGAPHLVDPSRLWASASRIYGDAMTTLWGEMLPVAEPQITTLQGGDTVTLGGHSIHIIHSPGHAGSHVVYQLDGDLFTGDAAAIAMGDAGDVCTLVRPAVPPPEVNLELWQTTFSRLRNLSADRLLLTHFGAITDVTMHLEVAEAETQRWAEVILAGMQADEDNDALAKRLNAHVQQTYVAAGLSEALTNRYNTTSNDAMSVMGLTRYWKKYHPDKDNE